MKNYTERLKKYWNSNDLVFTTTFKRKNTSTGVFTNLMNLNGKLQIYYPIFDDIDIGFKGVQFNFNNDELLDNSYHVIKLKFNRIPNKRIFIFFSFLNILALQGINFIS